MSKELKVSRLEIISYALELKPALFFYVRNHHVYGKVLNYE